MIKFFESNSTCHIVLEQPIINDDIQILDTQLSKKYISWHVEFGRVYNVNTEIVEILHKEIFINKKNISISTHKNKLNRYLTKLGFRASFNSLIKQDVVKLSNVEVVLIGGSADSSPKILEIIKNISLDNLALVIVQHVEADKVGIFDEIIQRYTEYKVSYVKDGQKLQKKHIYLAQRDKHLKIVDGFFSLSDEEKYNYSKPSVSISYESFSNYYKEKLLVIQECGYASDGVDKLELLKQNSSKLIIQNIDECEAKPMVKNALNVEVHDYVFKTKEIITYINIIDNKTTREAWLEYLLEKIYEIYNYDFKLYHRDMVNRRISVFMIKHDIKNIKDAIGVILFNKSAFKAFFLEISINVTELFRNPKSYKKINDFILKDAKYKSNLKLWSAGCSSGEEIYSISMLLENLNLLEKSIIYATDFNSVIIEEAKNGIFSNESYLLAKENVAKTQLNLNLDDYIAKNDKYITVNDKIKNKVLFFQHNLAEDSSFNEFDIIICKNVIIYFNDTLQKKVFQLFYDSLKFGGYLILGESEHLQSSFVNRFEIYDNESKIFKKVA